MRAIDVLCAICAAVDKGDEPELILAEDSPLMEDARELLKPKEPYDPPMLSRMDDLVDERNYLMKKVVALEESIERTFDDMAVVRKENTALLARIAELEAEEQLFHNTFDAQQMIIDELRAENQRMRDTILYAKGRMKSYGIVDARIDFPGGEK